MSMKVLEPILADPKVNEILINGPDEIYLEKDGVLQRAEHIAFENEADLVASINDLLAPFGKPLTEATPIIDVRLADSSLVHVVGRPIAILGPSVTISKRYNKAPFTLDDLVGYESMTADMAQLIKAAIEARLNILIAGGTASGKTSVLNALARLIDPAERIVTVEVRPELILDRPNLVRLACRPVGIDGQPEVNMRHLIQSATLMRPGRLIVHELHGPEAFDAVEAINTGHEGTILNLHAANARDALSRLEVMMTEGNPVMPLTALRESINSAVDLLIYQERLRNGQRVMSLCEVVPMQGGILDAPAIFYFERHELPDGTLTGHFTATGRIPSFYGRLSKNNLPLSIFTPIPRP